jgi:DNA polymerase-4/DNA polymerase V
MLVRWPNTIALIDADYFYANCELARHPEYRGKPLMVLGKLGSCILAKSPQAKKAGIGSAMPFWEAKKICPKGIYLEGDFRYYTLMSRRLMEILRQWSPVVDVYSVDEAFMDMNGLRGLYRKPFEKIALEIQDEVHRSLGITVSFGISVNKTLAKMAVELRKPNGVLSVPGKGIDSFLATLPVSEIPGIGFSRSALMEKWGIRTALQFAQMPQSLVQRLCGGAGLMLWRETRGETSFPLLAEPPPPKSIGRTSSFDKPTPSLDWVHGYAAYHMERALESLCRNHLLAGEFTLYLRDKAFRTYGLSHRFENPTNDFFELASALQKLLLKIPPGQIWRSSGAMLTRLVPETGQQLDLFEDPQKRICSEQLNEAKLKLNERFGRTTVQSGATLLAATAKPKGDGRRLQSLL